MARSSASLARQEEETLGVIIQFLGSSGCDFCNVSTQFQLLCQDFIWPIKAFISADNSLETSDLLCGLTVLAHCAQIARVRVAVSLCSHAWTLKITSTAFTTLKKQFSACGDYLILLP